MADYNVKYNIIIDSGNSKKDLTDLQTALEKFPKTIPHIEGLNTQLRSFEGVDAPIRNITREMKLLSKAIGKVNAGMKRFQEFSGMKFNTAATKATSKAMKNMAQVTQIANPVTVPKPPSVPASTTTATGSGASTNGSGTNSTTTTTTRKTLKDLSKRAFGMGSIMYGAGFPFPDMIGAGVLGMGVRSIAESYAEYEKTMTMTKNILKSTDKDVTTFSERFGQMSKNIRKIGVDTQFTTTEVAGAAKYLAMAGMSINDINNSMKSISSLAIITDAPLDRIADVVTNIQTAYGLSSEKMPQISDILTSVASSSNTNILEMGEAMKFAAPMMSMGRISFNEAAAAIGALANAGLKGTVAGTALRAMMTRLLAPTKKGAAVLEKYNIQLYELDKMTGKQKLRSLTDIFTQFNTKGASIQDMIAVFDKIGGNAANNLFAELRQLPELVQRTLMSTGLANRTADDIQDTIQGRWNKITSQFTETGMNVFENISPVIKGGMDQILAILQKPETAQFFTQVASTLTGIARVVIQIVDVISSHWNIFSILFMGGFAISRVTPITKGLVEIYQSMKGIGGAATIATQAIGTAATATTAGTGLMGALGGLGGIAGIVLGGIAAYGLSIWTNFSKAEGSLEMVKNRLDEMRGFSLDAKSVTGSDLKSGKKNLFRWTEDFLSNKLLFDVTKWGVRDKVTEGIQNLGMEYGHQVFSQQLKDILSVKEEDIRNNPSKAGYIFRTRTNNDFYMPKPTVKIGTLPSGNGNGWIATLIDSQKPIGLTEETFQRSDMFYKGAIQELDMYNPALKDLTVVKERMALKETIPYDTVVSIVKGFTNIDFNKIPKTWTPQMVKARLNEGFNALSKVLGEEGADVYATLLKIAQKQWGESYLPESLMYGERTPNIDTTTTDSSLSRSSKVQADPTKRITLNIQNLIGSFTVEYNGPEDQAKIKDIVMQTIIDAANEATLGLMSQS